DRTSGSITSVPPGEWAVAVSGGADSVALLELLRSRADLQLHIVHLDHETRAGASADDAKFVADLAAKFGLPCTVAKRSQVEPSIAKLPKNRSARYRAARIQFFREVVKANNLLG